MNNSNNNKQLLVKAKVAKGEIRRFSIAVPNDFAAFASAVAAALEISSERLGKVAFVYEDDEGDAVALLNTADLMEALRQVGQSEDKLLRLSVRQGRDAEERKQRQEQRHHQHEHHCGRHSVMGPLSGLLNNLKVGLPELLSNPAIRSMAEGMIASHGNLVKVDTGHICDNCQGPVIGDRYASTTQADYDLCSMCMLSDAGAKLQAVHQFRKVSAFQALMGCLSNGGEVEAFFASEPKADEKSSQQKQQQQHNAICDMCNMSIVGTRYKSMMLEDYDECAQCRSKSSRPANEFYEITDRTQRTVPDEATAHFRAMKEAEKAQAAAEAAKREAEVAAKKASEAEAAKKAQAAEVEAAKKAQAAKPAPSAPAAPVACESVPSAFEQNLQTLESMGFTDRKKSISALVRNRNRLYETLQSLIDEN